MIYRFSRTVVRRKVIALCRYCSGWQMSLLMEPSLSIRYSLLQRPSISIGTRDSFLEYFARPRSHSARKTDPWVHPPMLFNLASFSFHCFVAQPILFPLFGRWWIMERGGVSCGCRSGGFKPCFGLYRSYAVGGFAKSSGSRFLRKFPVIQQFL